jgi:hypothetical protein
MPKVIFQPPSGTIQGLALWSLMTSQSDLIGELAPHYLGIRNSYPPRDARNHVIRKLRNARSCAMRIAHAIMWIT